MAKRQKKPGKEIPAWVVTYGDLMSLLLCFFILLAAFSELKDPDEFRKVVEVIREALGYKGGMGHADIPDSPTNAMVNMLEEAAKRADNEMFVSEQNETNTVGRDTKVSIVHDGNYQTVGKTIWFEPGMVDLSPRMQQQLREEVAPLIRDRNNIVRVVGHASGYQDLTGGSHHAVAFARAEAALDFLVDECGVDARILRIESAGNVEPLAETGGTAERVDADRRVQIYMTDRLIDQVSRDAFGTGRGR
ncbi:MAG: flagellar motor protein MotB [Planctomycetota bacterium]